MPKRTMQSKGIENKIPESIALLATENENNHNQQFPIHCCAPVIHLEINEMIMNYKKFIKNPLMRNVQENIFRKEFGNLGQGDDRIREI